MEIETKAVKNELSDDVLIAEFDGWKPKHGVSGAYIRKKIGGDGFNTVKQNNFLYSGGPYWAGGSWNVIMPVVKKIHECSVPLKYYEKLSEALVSADYEKTYIAVVDFIKWYNENKK